MHHHREPESEFLTSHELAAMLKLDLSTLSRRRTAGLRPYFITIGKSVRYKRSEVDDFLSNGTSD